MLWKIYLLSKELLWITLGISVKFLGCILPEVEHFAPEKGRKPPQKEMNHHSTIEFFAGFKAIFSDWPSSCVAMLGLKVQDFSKMRVDDLLKSRKLHPAKLTAGTYKSPI